MSRYLQRFRLAPVYKWSDLAPFVKSVAIRFDAAGSGTLGSKELWRQMMGPKVRGTFPKLAVDLELTEGLEDPVTKIVFIDDTQMELKAKGKSVDDLLTEIQDYASILERKENIPDYEMPKLPDNV